MPEDLDDHRRIFDVYPEQCVEEAAMIFKAPPQLGQCSMSMSCLSSRAQLMRAGAPYA